MPSDGGDASPVTPDGQVMLRMMRLHMAESDSGVFIGTPQLRDEAMIAAMTSLMVRRAFAVDEDRRSVTEHVRLLLDGSPGEWSASDARLLEVLIRSELGELEILIGASLDPKRVVDLSIMLLSDLLRRLSPPDAMLIELVLKAESNAKQIGDFMQKRKLTPSEFIKRALTRRRGNA